MLDVTVGGGSKGPVSDEAMERKMKLAAKQRAATEKAPVTTSFLTEGQVRLQKLERHLNMKTERFNELKNTFKNHAELPVPESKKISAFADGFTAELDAIDRDHDMLDFQGLEDCLKELRDSQYANELERSRTGVTASDFLRIGGQAPEAEHEHHAVPAHLLRDRQRREAAGGPVRAHRAERRKSQPRAREGGRDEALRQ